MTDWAWEYMSHADHTVGGMHPDLIAQVEQIAQRLTDAASAKYLGDPPIEESGVSRLLTFAEGRWLITYQEHWRHHAIYIVQVEYWQP